MNRRRFLQLLATLPFAGPLMQEDENCVTEPQIPDFQNGYIGPMEKPGDRWEAGDHIAGLDETAPEKGKVIFVTENGDDANDGLSLGASVRTHNAALLRCADAIWWICSTEDLP